MVLVVLTYSQFYSTLWGFEVSRSQRASRPVLGIVVGSVIAVLLILGLVLGTEAWKSIDILYVLGYIKLLATFVKYIPQVHVNFIRKSTAGWSIYQILFDITGGVLSISQLVIDASFQGDWSGITGNPLKFGLGCVSVFFDVIFITQHYVLYKSAPESGPKTPDSEARRPLLND